MRVCASVTECEVDIRLQSDLVALIYIKIGRKTLEDQSCLAVRSCCYLVNKHTSARLARTIDQ